MPTTKNYGYSGTEIISGRILEDYNPELLFPNSTHIYDKMRKGDATVAAVMRVMKQPIIRANFFVEPYDDSAESAAVAEFVDDVFFKRLDFVQFMTDMLLCLDFGFMVFEKIYNLEENVWTYKALAPRLPKSIDYWIPNPNGDTPGVVQNISAPKAASSGQANIYGNTTHYGQITIPSEKIFLVNFNREGDNYEGISILRPAYRDWYFKDQYYQMQGVAAEKNSLGILIGKPREDMVGNITPEEQETTEKSLASLQSHEQQYFYSKGHDIEILTPSHQWDFDPGILHHDRQISKMVLAQFLEIGVSKGGNSQSDSQQSLALQASSAITDGLLGHVKDKLIKEIVDLNFENVEGYPTIKASGIEKDDTQDKAKIIRDLSQGAGMDFTDLETQNSFRRALDLPEKKEEDFTEPTQEPESTEEDLALKKKLNLQTFTGKHEELVRAGIIPSDFRPLTLQEERVDFISYKRELERGKKRVEQATTSYARKLAIFALQQSIRKINGEIFRRTDDDLTAAAAKLRRELNAIMNSLVDFGKTAANNEIGQKGRVATPPEVRSSIKSSASVFVEKMRRDVLDEALLTTNSAIQKQSTDAEAKSAVRETVNKKLTRSIAAFVSVAVNGSVNQGFESTFAQNKDFIWGYQYSSILDSRTTNVCLSLDGRVSRNSSDIPIPPVHANCRSRRVAILKTQTILPKENKPPKTVVEKISPNPFNTQQPNTPRTGKSTPARGEIESREQ